MAKTTKAKKTADDKSEEIPLLKDGRLKRIFGLILILFSFLFLLSIVSHIFTGNADEVTTSTVVVDDFGNELKTNNEKNILGVFGAFVSKILVKNLFGLCALFIPFLMVIYGVNILFDKKIFKWKKLTFHSIFLMLFIAATLEFFRFLFYGCCYKNFVQF
jgi:S-DNA-T family DNA segregation ATPase FtsK/SpoIIIE